jgi:putative phosphoesterase
MKPVLTVGIISDTHIPDRASELHPGLISTLKELGVDQILHAGDICVPGVLEELGKVAPVCAVKGNRDWAFNSHLPLFQHLTLAGQPVVLMHGHGGWIRYIYEKWFYLTQGYNINFYVSYAKKIAPEAKIIIFGHTHRPVNQWIDGRLYFNPGAANSRNRFRIERKPSMGVLRFDEQGNVAGEIIELKGAKLEGRNWILNKI